MRATRLTGLEGTNPLGFLAALGVQVAFASAPRKPRLWWSDDVTPCALVDEEFSVDRIAGHAIAVFRDWMTSPALAPVGPDGQALKGNGDLKLSPNDIRTYLRVARRLPGASVSTALVAEGSLDNNGIAKPSDLYFTAGQQRFLKFAREILGAAQEDVLTGLVGPWSYRSSLPSLMWDVTDDRVYALRAYDPTSASEKKLSNPGAEALALLGLSRHPVFGAPGRTLTQGCSGSWKRGFYSWPLWHKPASIEAVRSLLAHAFDHEGDRDRTRRRAWFRSWGVEMVLRSPIRRSSQGGYGTFGPPEIVWRVSADSTRP